MAMALTAAAQARQQRNPSYLVLTAATATSSPTAAIVTTTADACKRDEDARGSAWGGGMLAQASFLLKAVEANKDKALSALAKLPACESSLSLLSRGGGGRRLALAGRRLATRCVLVDEQDGRGGCLLGGRRWPC
jgi:hypothetical protein